jgi:hypothetical protein
LKIERLPIIESPVGKDWIITVAILTTSFYSTPNQIDTTETTETIIQTLTSGNEYSLYVGKLRHFLRDADPPLEQEGTVWKVRAPMYVSIELVRSIPPAREERR